MFLRTWTCALTTAVLACLVPALATAEAGDGLRAGNLSLSPGVTANSEVDSNVFRQSTSESSPLLGSSLALAPFLSIATIDPVLADFAFDGRVAWQQYLNFDNAALEGQSGLTADVGARVAFNKDGAVSFQIEDRLQRTNEPPAVPTDFAYNRTTNRLGGTLGVHPGGKVFQHYLSYDWNVVVNDEIDELNRQIHDFTLKNYWRFLPRTAAVVNADYAVIRYAQASRAGIFTNVNSTPLRITGGLTGLITNRLSVRAIAGWAFGFYDAGPSFSGLVTDLQTSYAFGGRSAEGNRLYLGYQRDFQDSTVSNFASFHRPYAGYEQVLVSERLKLDIRADSMVRSYAGTPVGTFPGAVGTVTIQDELQDLIFRASARVDYNIYKWWTIFGGYYFSANFTDDVIVSSLPANDAVREYQRHLVTVGTTFRY